MLFACLLPLRDGGPTSRDEVPVHDAWATAGYLAVIYTSPWHPKVGVVHTRESLACGDPAEAGSDLANFSIAGPLGTVIEHPCYDADGVGLVRGAAGNRRVPGQADTAKTHFMTETGDVGGSFRLLST